MRQRLASVVLLLYPPRVRNDHGREILTLIDDLITHEGRSRTRLFVRLTLDGLVQRVASTATVWTVIAVLMTVGPGTLAVSDLAAANVFRVGQRTGHRIAPASHTHHTPRHSRRRRHKYASTARDELATSRARPSPRR